MFSKTTLLLLCVLFVIIAGVWFTGTVRYNTTFSSPKAELGYYLFFDKIISVNHSRSCASCHDPSLAFTDGYRSSVTTLGENLKHNAPSLLNVASLKVFDWAHPGVSTLSQQMLRPLFSHAPIELGLDQHEDSFYAWMKTDSLYKHLIEKAFPGLTQWSRSELLQCLSAYEMMLQSTQARYDQFLHGNQRALNTSEHRGRRLFFSDRLKCRFCHGGELLSNATVSSNPDSIYFNIGLYAEGVIPKEDSGLYAFTHQQSDLGKFKVPSLRNVSITSPYMHDGSVATLEEVLDIYARGGRSISNGPWIGDGRFHPNKHRFIAGFVLSPDEKKDIIAFLKTLTDTSYLTKPWARYPDYFKRRLY